MEKEYLISYVLYRKHVTPADTIVGGRELGKELVNTEQSIRSNKVLAANKKEAMADVAEAIKAMYGEDSTHQVIAITCLDD